MNDPNPIDSLFRDALREAEVPAPDGVFQAVQAQLSVASSAAASGTGLLAKASIWVLAAGGLVTALWLNVESSSSLGPKSEATINSAAISVVPAEKQTDDDLTSPEPISSNYERGSTYISTSDMVADTTRENNFVVRVVPQGSMIQPSHSPRMEPLASSVNKPVSCRGSAQGRLSDLAGACVQFESIEQADARAHWKIDGVPVYSQSGSHCPDFGQRERISLVLFLSHSSGCVDSQVFWIRAPKLDIPNYVIPDVITPNGDGLNDQFYVEFDRYPEKYELLIFDQLNRLVFRSEDPRENWKAQCYQTPCPAGLYRVVLTTQFEGQAEVKVNRQPLLIKK